MLTLEVHRHPRLPEVELLRIDPDPETPIAFVQHGYGLARVQGPTAHVRVDGRDARIGPGLYTLPPGAFVSAAGTAEHEVSILVVRADAFERAVAGDRGRLRMRGCGTASSSLESPFDLLARGLSVEADARSLGPLLAALLEGLRGSMVPDVGPRGGPRWLALARARLEEGSGAGAPGVASIADEIGVSRFALVRAFKKALGASLVTYRRQHQLAVARDALWRGARIRDVVDAGGFADQSHMTRAFQEHWRTTPGRYRQAGRDRVVPVAG